MTPRILLPALVLSALAVFSGCSASEDSEEKASCDARAKTDGVCPGVTSAAVSTDGIACTSRVEVSSQAELDSKVGSATAGSCLVLAGGTFATIKLPASVHLIGKGAGSTKVDMISVSGGAGSASTLRGLGVGKGGIVATGGGTVTIDAVHVIGATGVGISALDTNLVISSSTIEKNGGFGIESACQTNCTARVGLALRRVLVRENKRMGVLAQNVDVTMDGAQIDGTLPLDFQYGRGIEVSYGGTLVAKNLAVLKNADVGIFVDEGSADLSNFTSSGNQRGVQLQGVKSSKLDNFDILDNTALGIGVGRGSVGIIVQGGRVASTKMLDVPVDIGGIEGVGDGINWLDGSEVNVTSTVKIESSARRPVIISATSKGSFEGTLGGGDELTGIIVQGGLEASMPSALNIASAVKSVVLTKDQAMPVAMAVSAAVKKTR